MAFIMTAVDGIEDAFVMQDDEWIKLGIHRAWMGQCQGEFTEEEEEMGTQVHIVMANRGDGTGRIVRVCSDLKDAREKSRNTPIEQGTTWVMSHNVEDPEVVAPYRVWITFKEGGPEFRAELRLSIPMQKGVFEPIEPPAQTHGSVTVDATNEEDAIAKAKNILFAYLTGGPVAQEVKPGVPRR